jgi:predicted transcriptional regulator
MPGVKKNVSLTQEEAQRILDSLNTDGISLRDAEDRTEVERLAIGLVCLKRNIEGKSQRIIGEEMGLPQATVSRYINRALQTVALPTVMEARVHAIEKVDRHLAIWEPRADTGDEKAAAVVAKFLEQRHKLTGAFSPVEVNQYVTEETQTEREMRLLLEQAERDNKMKAAQVDAD